MLSMSPITLLIVYCLFIVLASLAGGWLPFLIHLTHMRMQLMISLVGGLMLGIGLFHLLPHAVAELGSLDRAVWWMMIGLLGMFFLLRTFQFHEHSVAEVPDAAGEGEHGPDHSQPHDHAHAPRDFREHPEHGKHAHRLGWIGVAFGLALHTLIDGMALGASIQADAAHEVRWSLFGLGTFLAILLHKPLDAVSITSLMTAGGWPARWRHAVNAGFALMCPLGAVLFFLGVERFSEHHHVLVGCALAFSAGVFLCISLGDLLPELGFHRHDRVKLSAMLLFGIVLAYSIRYLEPEYAHYHAPEGRDAPEHKHSDEAPHPHDAQTRGRGDAAIPNSPRVLIPALDSQLSTLDSFGNPPNWRTAS